jgi:hypothetical protein
MAPVHGTPLAHIVISAVPSSVRPFAQRGGDHPTAGTPDPVADVIAAVSQTHAAALWRCAIFLTRDRVRAKEVVAETLRRACQHPEIADYSDTSARAWPFAVARDSSPTSGHLPNR